MGRIKRFADGRWRVGIADDLTSGRAELHPSVPALIYGCLWNVHSRIFRQSGAFHEIANKHDCSHNQPALRFLAATFAIIIMHFSLSQTEL